MINLVIFSGSNKPKDDNLIETELLYIANNIDIYNYNIWYGGGESGLMGIIPKKFSENGGNVTGVDAKQFAHKYGIPTFCKTIIMDTFVERQNKLVSKGDIFLCLPGGIGTLSELFDVLVNIDVNNKKYKIILFSYNNFFEHIINFIHSKIEDGFIREKILDKLIVCKNSKEIVNNLKL
tara:strand:+ start:521 stop:1057 length:537 start_codon:yes stop_codon:yes gene_type:complete